MRLALGCGAAPTPGYVRMDINPAFDVDVIGAADDPLPWDDETFDEILATDILEHISYRRARETLHEWARVLKPGGVLNLQVPDTLTAVNRWLDGTLRTHPTLDGLPDLVSLARILLGGHDDHKYADDETWRFNAHYALFDEHTLRWFLTDAGFEVVSLEINAHPNLIVMAVKP